MTALTQERKPKTQRDWLPNRYPTHKLMTIMNNKKLINAHTNRQIANGRLVKFMCGVLNVVVKFTAPLGL